MDKFRSTRGMALLSALLATAFFAACEEVGPTAADLDVEPQFDHRPNHPPPGGGGDDGSMLTTIALTGGMVAVADDAVLADGSREIKFHGVEHVSSLCDAFGTDTDCYMAELALQDGVSGLSFDGGGKVNGFGPSCEMTDRKMTEADAYPLLDLLDDAEQARFIFEGEVNKRKGTGQLRVDWFEEDTSGNRYTYFLTPSQIGETRDVDGALQELVYSYGEIAMYGTGFSAFECAWSGTVTVSFVIEPEPPI